MSQPKQADEHKKTPDASADLTEQAAVQADAKALQGKVLPPDSPVDVPRMPQAKPLETPPPDIAKARDDKDTSWADPVEGGEQRKAARTYLHNG